MSASNNPGTATLGQQRACHAWNAVDRAKGKNGEKDYAREAKRLPVRIMTSGLGASLAFLDAKNKTEVSDDLADWLLKHRGFGSGSSQVSKTKALKRAIVEHDADFLRHATEEAMLYLKWLTRFAEAELKSED